MFNSGFVLHPASIKVNMVQNLNDRKTKEKHMMYNAREQVVGSWGCCFKNTTKCKNGHCFHKMFSICGMGLLILFYYFLRNFVMNFSWIFRF